MPPPLEFDLIPPWETCAMRSISRLILVLGAGLLSGCGSQCTAPRAALTPGASAGASLLGAEAGEAALSRLYAGIHFPHDNDQGLAVGFRLGARVVAHMRVDEARTMVLAARE